MSRRRTTRRRDRLHTVFGFTLILGAIVAGVGGFLAIREHFAGDVVVLSVEPAADPAPPPAIPPAAIDGGDPVSIRYEAVGVDDEIRPIGLASDGALEIPDETEVGWWRYGAAPGRPGATVLAAHVSWNGTTGPFNRLGDAEIGDRVEVTSETGSARIYQVVERTMYLKDGLPEDRIWNTSGDETLVLITCGGDFNPDIHRYRHNIVVYAVPVDSVSADPAEGTTPPSG